MFYINHMFILLSFLVMQGDQVDMVRRESEDLDMHRKEKLLNVFQIVNFPNAGCNSSSTDTYGVCYTSTECSNLGGTAAGSCAGGFGVCCTFSGSCSGSTSLNNTYFKSSTSDSSPCTFTVCRASSDVCQIRLGFDTFAINQPNTVTGTADEPYGRGQCQDAQFTANSDGPNPPTICGTNTGYHMIINAKDDCNTLSFTWTSSSTRSWNIHIMQIPCSATWKPPDGCTQYITGSSGYLYSYNYAGGVHLANQEYTHCIRTEQGYCSIEYTPVGGNFGLSGTAPTAIAYVGDPCSQDYLVIAGGGSSAGATTNYDRFCGSLFSTSNAATSGATLYTNKQPFQVGVYTDGSELNTPSTTSESSVGFYIYYKQTQC